MDGVLGVVAHDVLCHEIVGLGAVSESLAEDLIAKSGLVNLDQLTATGKAVDLSGDAGLEHAAETLGLGVLDRLVQRPETPVLAIVVDTDVATDTDELGVFADFPQHLPDTEFVKHSIGVHTNEVFDVLEALGDERVAEVLEQLVAEHGHDVGGALMEMVQERTRKAQAVTLALVVTLADKDIRNALVVTSLDLGRHEKTVSSAVAVFEEARWAGLQNVLKKVLLRGLLHSSALDIAVDDNEDHARVVVNILLRNQRVQRSSKLLKRLVVTRQKHDHSLRGLWHLLFAAEAEEDTLEDEVAQDKDNHDELEDGVGAEKHHEEVVGDVVRERHVDECGIDTQQADEQAPFLEPQERLGYKF